MAGLQIVEQGRDGEALIGLKLTVAVNGVVDHRQERVRVHLVVLTGLLYGLVAEAQADAEAAQHLQQVVVVADERDHLVVRLIHLLISHNYVL